MGDDSDTAGGQALGAYLKAARNALGLTLRGVEERTGRAVTNGYLSQIEGGTIAKPSPNVLYHLAQVYDLDYGDLLTRAGHRVPHSADTAQRGILAGFPMHAVEELTEDERAELLDYIAFLRSKRPSERGR
jgi:transcriptional regulator with XRE-family HTH domain